MTPQPSRLIAADSAIQRVEDNGVTAQARQEDKAMWILMLEAVGAGVLLMLIVWWTMFAGRRHGEPAHLQQADDTTNSPPP